MVCETAALLVSRNDPERDLKAIVARHGACERAA
jgi:hypothetical protein